MHVIPNLVTAAEKAPKSETSPANVARCVAAVVRSQQGVAAGVIAEYSKNLKVGLIFAPMVPIWLHAFCRVLQKSNLPYLS